MINNVFLTVVIVIIGLLVLGLFIYQLFYISTIMDITKNEQEVL